MACAVVLDGKRLQMSTGETEQEHILALEQGELMINWEHHRAGLGQAVEITSGADRHASSTSLEPSSQDACSCGCQSLRHLGPYMWLCTADLLSTVASLMPSIMLDEAFRVHLSRGIPALLFSCQAGTPRSSLGRHLQTLTVAMPTCRHAVRGGIPDPCWHPGRGRCGAARLHQL